MSGTDRHYGAEELVDYFCQKLDDDAARLVELHIAGCDACARLSRRVYVATSVLERTSMQSLRRAAAGRPATVGAAIREMVFTVQGWVGRGAAGRPTPGAAIGEWLFAPVFEPQGARLSGSATPMAFGRAIVGVGRLLVQIVPSVEGDWALVARLVEAAPGTSIVVGLGGVDRPHLGTRTVTPEQEQQFHFGPEDLAPGLHVRLEWQAADGWRHELLSLPVRRES